MYRLIPFVMLSYLLCGPSFAQGASSTSTPDAAMPDAEALIQAQIPSLNAGIIPESIASDANLKTALDAGTIPVDGGTNTSTVDTKAPEKAHKVILLTAMGLLFVTSLARKFGGIFWPFLMTDRGGALLVVTNGFLTALISALATPNGTEWLKVLNDVFEEGVLLATASAGLFSIGKKTISPSDAKSTPTSTKGT